jgi:hypothetical protein
MTSFSTSSTTSPVTGSTETIRSISSPNIWIRVARSS